jgi:ATP-dependent DNA helicase RecG
MRSAEKEETMGAFSRGEIQVLVSTTVVEVGVDVENATVMVIEHAERFGLAQLHQLRGRVGRGRASSTCVLLAYGRLSEVARARLDVMVRTEDGFAIAEKDLEIRGPGDFFGTRQWGMPTFRVADLVRDRDLLERARAEAFRLVGEGGVLPSSLDRFLGEGGWERRFGLARVG